jgi:hypothetical protein
MKHPLFLLCLLIVAWSASAQTPSCWDFRNGTFIIVDAESGNSIIERKGRKQTEYGEGSRLRLTFRVKWINDCTYTLNLKKVIENPNNINLPEGLVVTVEILETKQHSYIQRSTSNLFDKVVVSELQRMGDLKPTPHRLDNRSIHKKSIAIHQ